MTRLDPAFATRTASVRLGSVGLAYEEHGDGARPFVLVHGFTGSRDDWREQLPRLAADGRTVALDLRGHGDSTNTGDPSSYTLAQLADDLVRFLDALGIERCDLLGHSMGGIAAQRVALDRPERVASVVLMDTTAEPIHPGARAIFAAGGRLAREAGMEALFEVTRGSAQRTPPSPAVARAIERMGADVHWERIRRKLVAMDPEAFATLGVALTECESTVARLGAIRCPTTVLVGAEDAPFLAPAQVLADAIPGARHVVIPEAGHSPQLENPDAWLAAVRAHLAWSRGA